MKIIIESTSQAGISLTENQIENVCDSLKQAGFDFPDGWGNEHMAKLIDAVLYGLNIEI